MRGIQIRMLPQPEIHAIEVFTSAYLGRVHIATVK